MRQPTGADRRGLAPVDSAFGPPMPQLSVTIVAHEVGTLGGMERSLGILAQGLVDAGIRVTVIARQCALSPHPLLAVHCVRTPRRPFPIGYILFALAGSWTLRRHGSGVVHATGAIVIPVVDCITVQFCHAAYHDLGVGPRPSGPGWLRDLNARMSDKMAVLAERWCYRQSRARSVVALSVGVRDEVERYFPSLADRLSVIPHGVDSDRFKPDPVARRRVRAEHGLAADDLVAVFVGGDWKRKGLSHALEAVARTENWKLLVVGRGHQQFYEQLARDLAVAERVRFAGLTGDAQGHLAAGDVFLLPTEYETFCLAAFEAAAVGLPLLVTRVSGPDMLLEPGVNGEFIDNDAERTARFLAAYADRERRADHGGAARARAQSFGWDQAVSAYRALFQQLSNTAGESPVVELPGL
jgi:glycosyltransferase involved in cell wall biosynthesis